MTTATRSPVEAELHTRSLATLAWILAASCTAGAALIVTVTTGVPGMPSTWHPELIAVTAMVLAGACLAAVRALRTGAGAQAPVAAALVAALALGPLLAPSGWPRATELGLLCGLVAAASVALALRLGAAGTIYDRMLGVIPAWCALFAFVILGALAATVPPLALAAAVVACTPMALRMLPAASVSVPSEQLLDHSVLMRLRWAVRSPIPAPPQRIEFAQVEALVRSGRLQQAASTAWWCLAAVMACMVVATQSAESLAQRIATGVLGACLIAFLLLSPRRSRAPFDRWVSRGAALAVLAQFALLWLPRSVPGGSAGTALAVLVVLAVAVAAMTVPVGAGITSLGLSRLGDFIEGAAVVLIVPAGFVAGGFIELFRGLA